MAVPGLNSPGLVPQKSRKSYDYGPDFGGKTVTGDFDYVRESKINHFWNDSGIQSSVPKVKGIVTPKSTGSKPKLEPEFRERYGQVQ
jgi:hypothetical protein